MKNRYWILIGTLAVIVFITYVTIEKRVSEYFFFKKQQHRIEQGIFQVFQTIDQYNRLFGTLPPSFNDKKLIFLLKENLVDSLVLNLKPNIKKDASTKMYYVYLNGPDGRNDSLKTIVNKDYVPTKTEIIGNSLLLYCFSEGDIYLGSSSYTNGCDEKTRRFVYIDNEDRVILESDSIRKTFYLEVDNYIKSYVKDKKLKPASKTYFVYCSFKFDETVSSRVLCVSEEGNDENINGFLAELASYIKDKSPRIKEVYFSLYINEALVLPPR